jgi:WD40 repeat protein/mono/diheme cytochrome c family protein
MLPSLAADKITYDEHVFPIFEQSCLNCHNPDKTKGGLDLSSYTNTLKGGSGGKIAEAGDTSSTLLTSVMRTGELKMPPEGDAISPAQIATLKAWIEGGLLENKNSTARAAKKPAFQASVASAGKKPEGPPPMPAHVLLEPVVTASRGAAVHSIAASPWAPLIAISSLRQVMLIHAETLELVGILPFPEGEPVSLSFTPDARYLIVGGGIAGKSGTTVTFDVTTGQRVLTAAKEFDSILCCDIRPGFDVVATGSPSRLVKLWNTQSQELARSIKKHTDWVTALDISPDGILLATGDRNGGVLVWEADSGGDFHTLRAHQNAITRALFRGDSNLLGTASEDGTIRMWEMNGGTEVKKIDAHGGGVRGFDWARDGSFASTGRDRKVRLWKADFSLARELGTIPALPTALAIDAEGKRVFVGDVDGLVHVIDAATGKILHAIANHPPTLAERIRVIDERLATLPPALAEAEKNIAAAENKHKEHQTATQQAEAALQQSRDNANSAQKKLTELQGKIATVRSTLTAKKTELDAARGLANSSRQAMEQAKQALATAQAAGDVAGIETPQAAARDAEAKFQQSQGAAQALEATVNQLTQDEQGTAAAIAQAEQEHNAAKAKIPLNESALKGLRDATPSLAQAVEAAKKSLIDLQNEPRQLRQSRHHWIAAQTNAKALAAQQVADTEQSNFEDLIATFAEKAKALEALAAQRQEALTALQTLGQETPPEDEKALAAWQKKIADQQKTCDATQQTLRSAEQEIITLRQQIDALSPARVQSLRTSRHLQQEYLRQLAQKVE